MNNANNISIEERMCNVETSVKELSERIKQLTAEVDKLRLSFAAISVITDRLIAEENANKGEESRFIHK